MTAAKVAAPYRSGLCHSARHDRCRGAYGTAVCDCPCHTEPEPEPEVLGEIAAALTELGTAAAIRHCPTCTCGDPR